MSSQIISRTTKNGKMIAAQVVFKSKGRSITRHMRVMGDHLVAKDGTTLKKG